MILTYDNTLESICDLIGDDPGNYKIPRLQESFPSMKNTIAELIDKIGTGLFIFDSHPLYSPKPENKSTSPVTLNSHGLRIAITSLCKLYLSPLYTSSLFGGLTESQNGGQTLLQLILHSYQASPLIYWLPPTSSLLPYYTWILTTPPLSPLLLQGLLPRLN